MGVKRGSPPWEECGFEVMLSSEGSSEIRLVVVRAEVRREERGEGDVE